MSLWVSFWSVIGLVKFRRFQGNAGSRLLYIPHLSRVGGLIMQVAAASRREDGGCATDPASTLHVPHPIP